ncbi:hypothetical protein SPSIL_021000 [Sporomusa silvacetica DSM 10669]|uniref:Pilus assembly protein, PilO n=1 Tax=Sporomusa silvacetica DSM 10669 TaxID=1123289 RepID=A0ABZ3IKF3_9FIRM|nr:type 4a pilus biogenesis protein PilO [Sporomusa silvacetica]OZC18648.1 pilus assembly protein, PilO [Sporomusa silvacetica DSM 10669]
MEWLGNWSIKYKAIAQYKGWVLGVGALLVTLLFYIGIVIPQRATIAVVKNQYQTERERLKIIEAYAKKHPDSISHLKELDQKLTLIDAKLPNQPELGEFIKEIEQASNLSKMRLAEIKPTAAINNAGYLEIPIEVLLKGSFTNLLEFIKTIEGSQRFTSISNTNIQAKQGMLEVKLTMVIYSFGVAGETKLSSQNSDSSTKK